MSKVVGMSMIHRRQFLIFLFVTCWLDIYGGTDGPNVNGQRGGPTEFFHVLGIPVGRYVPACE